MRARRMHSDHPASRAAACMAMAMGGGGWGLGGGSEAGGRRRACIHTAVELMYLISVPKGEV